MWSNVTGGILRVGQVNTMTRAYLPATNKNIYMKYMQTTDKQVGVLE